MRKPTLSEEAEAIGTGAILAVLAAATLVAAFVMGCELWRVL